MANKVGAPKKDPELVKSNCGYKLPKWLKDLIREQYEPAGVLIERVLKEHIVMQCLECGDVMPVGTFNKFEFDTLCGSSCDAKLSSFKKVII